MTKLRIEVKEKTYAFEGEDIHSALSSAKYSRVPLTLVRTMGITWSRKILWPTFKNLNKGRNKWTSADLSLPNTLRSILKSKTKGKLNADLNMNVRKEEFEAEASGRFTSSDLNLNFESSIEKAEKAGKALKEALNLFSNYNVDVKKIVFQVDKNNSDKRIDVSLDAAIPKDLSHSVKY